MDAIIRDAKNGRWIDRNCKFAKKGKAVNPWAVCNSNPSTAKKNDPENFEDCVQGVKEDHPVRQDVPKKKKDN